MPHCVVLLRVERAHRNDHLVLRHLLATLRLYKFCFVMCRHQKYFFAHTTPKNHFFAQSHFARYHHSPSSPAYSPSSPAYRCVSFVRSSLRWSCDQLLIGKEKIDGTKYFIGHNTSLTQTIRFHRSYSPSSPAYSPSSPAYSPSSPAYRCVNIAKRQIIVKHNGKTQHKIVWIVRTAHTRPPNTFLRTISLRSLSPQPLQSSLFALISCVQVR